MNPRHCKTCKLSRRIHVKFVDCAACRQRAQAYSNYRISRENFGFYIGEIAGIEVARAMRK